MIPEASRRSARFAAAVALAAMVSTASAAAQSPAASDSTGVPLSLADAIRIGEQRSEAIDIARAGVRRAEGQQYQARSQRLPQLYGSAGYTRTLKSQFEGAFAASTPDTTKPKSPEPPCDAYLRNASSSVAERLAGLELAQQCSLGLNPFSAFSSLPFGQEHQYQMGLSFSQNIFTGGRVSAQNEIARSGRRASDLELSAQRAQLVLDVTQAYYDAALADRLAAIAESSFQQTENVYRQTQLSRTVGTMSEFDLLRAQVTRDNQRPLMIQRLSDREVAYLRLKQLLDLPLGSGIRLTTAVDDTAAAPPGVRLASLPADTAAASRAAVLQAAEGVNVQQGLVRIARSQRLPAISLTSQFGRVAYPRDAGPPSWADFRTNWTVGVGAQLPIFTGGRIRGEEIVAQANLAEARARLQQVREYAALDARVAVNALNQAIAAWNASAGTSEQAARAYQIAEVRYREGISTQIELNDARILLAQAQANRALAARNLQLARVRLALLPRLPLQGAPAPPQLQQPGIQQGQQPQSQQPSGTFQQ